MCLVAVAQGSSATRGSCTCVLLLLHRGPVPLGGVAHVSCCCCTGVQCHYMCLVAVAQGSSATRELLRNLNGQGWTLQELVSAVRQAGIFSILDILSAYFEEEGMVCVYVCMYVCACCMCAYTCTYTCITWQTQEPS